MIASRRRESILIRKLINGRIGIGSEDKATVAVAGGSRTRLFYVIRQLRDRCVTKTEPDKNTRPPRFDGFN